MDRLTLLIHWEKKRHNLTLQWQNYPCSQRLDLLSVLSPSATKALQALLEEWEIALALGSFQQRQADNLICHNQTS